MKLMVERELELARKNLRSLTHFSPGRTSADRQKLLVMTMQDVSMYTFITLVCNLIADLMFPSLYYLVVLAAFDRCCARRV